MKNNKGFTVVELIIVVVIVCILGAVSFPIYRGYVRKNIATEGRALLGNIQTAQKVYYTEFQHFASVDTTSISPLLDIDASKNKYFKEFSVVGDEENWSAVTVGTKFAKGITLVIKGDKNGKSEFTETGLQ